MNTEILSKIEKTHLKDVPEIRVGDTVEAYTYITEGGKTRTQIFKGLVIAIKGSGTRKMITVRKISSGVGVERIFPLHSPNIKEWVVLGNEKVRRAKLYYMRDRVGKAASRIKKGKAQV
jgi:large subunit ribosomal protein L19